MAMMAAPSWANENDRGRRAIGLVHVNGIRRNGTHLSFCGNHWRLLHRVDHGVADATLFEQNQILGRQWSKNSVGPNVLDDYLIAQATSDHLDNGLIRSCSCGGLFKACLAYGVILGDASIDLISKYASEQAACGCPDGGTLQGFAFMGPRDSADRGTR